MARLILIHGLCFTIHSKVITIRKMNQITGHYDMIVKCKKSKVPDEYLYVWNELKKHNNISNLYD